MNFVTFKVSVTGDTYEEIKEKAEEEICNFLGIDSSDEQELNSKVNYELVVEQDLDFEAEFSYKAEVIARIK